MIEKIVAVIVSDGKTERKMTKQEYDNSIKKNFTNIIFISNNEIQYQITKSGEINIYFFSKIENVHVSLFFNYINDEKDAFFQIVLNRYLPYMFSIKITKKGEASLFENTTIDAPKKTFHFFLKEPMEILSNTDINKLLKTYNIMQTAILVKDFIKIFQSIAGRNISQEEFIGFIENGKLFESSEVRVETENQILSKKVRKAELIVLLNKAKKTISSILNHFKQFNVDNHDRTN